jgi:O-antigen/teichoic acid export membrane protein
VSPKWSVGQSVTDELDSQWHIEPRRELPRSGVIDALTKHTNLVRASIGVMASTAATSLSGWLFWIIATHHWITSQVGISTSLIAAMTVISLIAAQPVATTLLARLPRSSHPVGILRASCAFSTLIAVVLSVVAIFALPSTLSVVRTIGIAIPFVIGCVAIAIGVVLDAAAIAARRPLTMVIRNSSFGFGKLLVLGFVAIVLPATFGPHAVIVAWTGTCVVACAWSWFSLGRAPSMANQSEDSLREGAWDSWRQLRRGLVPQTLGSLGGSLPPQVLPIIVVGILGSTSAGWFSVTWLLGGLCFMISPAVSQALLADASHHPDQLAAKTRLACYVSAGILAVPLLIYVVASRPVLDLFGAKYAAHGHWLLVILAISAIPDLITNIAVARYRVLERLRMAAVVNVSIATVTVAGTAVFLHRVGIDGAGWAWTGGQVVGCVIVAADVALSRVKRLRPLGAATT